MPQITITIPFVPADPITARQAFSIGWNNTYCRTGYAFPPLDGALLRALEDGMEQGRRDRELDGVGAPRSCEHETQEE